MAFTKAFQKAYPKPINQLYNFNTYKERRDSMVLSDIEIANSVQMKPITEIAAELGLTEEDI